MGRARGANALMALAFESTYGVAPSSGFTKMGFTSADLGSTQPLVADDELGHGRDPQAPTQDVIETGGSLSIPVGVDSFGTWLKFLLGAPATTGSGPYTHLFSSGAAQLPSASIEIGHPEVPFYEMHSGLVLNELSIEAQRGRGSKLTASLNLNGQGSAHDTSSNAGVLAEVSAARFSHFNGAVKRNGAALGSVTMAKLTFNNNFDPIEAIRPDGKVGGFDAGVATLTGELRVRFDSDALVTQADSGDPCALSLGWQIDAGKSLEFLLPRVMLERPRQPVSGPGGIEVNFAFTGARQTDGGAMMQAKLINGVDSYA